MRAPPSRPLALLGAGLLAYCGLSACLEGCRAPGPAWESFREPAEAEPEAREPWLELLELTDRGADPEGRLVAWLREGRPRLRARAAWALGQLPAGAWIAGSDAAGEALARAAARDPEREVRLAALLALGLRGDPAAAPALLAALKDRDPELRARAAQAAGRLDDPALRSELPYLLFDADPGVRREAALAPHRWSRQEDARAGEVDHALLEALRRAPGGGPEAPEVRRALLFTLGRRASAPARRAFLEHLGDPDAEVRLFAAAGLAALEREEDGRARAESREALARASRDADWRVAVEALGALGRRGERESLPVVAGALEHVSVHVRRAAAAALGGLSGADEEVRRALQVAAADASPWVRAAALVAHAKLAGEAALPALDEAARKESALERIGAAEACALLGAAAAVERLLRLSEDPDPRVRWSAVEGLGRFAEQATARAKLRELLAADDPGLRLGAVLALGGRAQPEEVGLLAQAPRGTDGLEAEIAFEALVVLAGIEGPQPERILRAQLGHPDPYVAARAYELLAARGAEPPEHPSPARAPRRGAGRALLAQAAELLASEARPRLVLATERGELVLELLPELAPLHVASLLTLVRQGQYDGLLFHRVVSDFVVQGGDVRGDGNGSAPFGGRSLRRELGPEPFERGALGMPRNSDPDSGGSQLFLTHRSTPHLDGRYALLGRLVEGGAVLDRLEPGDRILAARTSDGP